MKHDYLSGFFIRNMYFYYGGWINGADVVFGKT